KLTDLSEDDFENFIDHAIQLSLADQISEEVWRLHPLVAELLRMRSSGGAITSSTTDFSEVQGDLDRIRSQTPKLRTLAICNFKSIPSLELDLAHVSALPGNWTCIAGINGAGKSAVLQAIALVLLGDRLSLVVGDQWLDRARRRTGDDGEDAEIRAIVQIGEETLELVLPIGAGRIDLEKAIPDPEQRDKIKAFWDERERHHLLLSYGAGRNLSEYVDSRHGTKSDDVRRQMTLFDPLTQVASVDVLLEQTPKHTPILKLLKRLLSVVLEGSSLEVAPNHESLRFLVDGAVVEAAELPDGFRATIAWLADLCAAWCAKAPYEAQSGDPSQIRAIVLIDEIDLHLHPSLQRVLVPRLRKALPEVQWIVTTHSPLVLSSFDKSELVLLDANEPGGKRVIDRQILGFTMDEVYEWLMGTEPHSAALDDLEGDPQDADARLALLLAQSPDVSEENATENRAFRQALAQKIREQHAEERTDATGGKAE
ncbi:MAG: AAA family ATPase, partial [Byssovorax sp.]